MHLVLRIITATHGLNTLLLKMQCFVTHAVFFIASHKFDNSFVTCSFCHWKNATGKGGKLERHNNYI